MQTMQIQISWLLKKPTDLDLNCLQRQGISEYSRTRVKIILMNNHVKSDTNITKYFQMLINDELRFNDTLTHDGHWHQTLLQYLEVMIQAAS